MKAPTLFRSGRKGEKIVTWRMIGVRQSEDIQRPRFVGIRESQAAEKIMAKVERLLDARSTYTR
jgi:predicted transcriptional regulator